MKQSEEETLYVCTDASVNDSNVADHLEMKYETEKQIKTMTISTNEQNDNTPHEEEEISTLKVITMIKKYECDKKCQII